MMAEAPSQPSESPFPDKGKPFILSPSPHWAEYITQLPH